MTRDHAPGRPWVAPVQRPGISLLEVLLALTIFLMALVAIARLVDLGVDRAMDTVAQNTGTRLAQSKLAEVEAGAIPVNGGGSGAFDEEPGWQWSVETEGAVVPNVYPVTVRVWQEARGRKHEIVLTQLVCDPLQMGTAAEAQLPATTSTGTGTTSSGGGTGSTGATTGSGSTSTAGTTGRTGS